MTMTHSVHPYVRDLKWVLTSPNLLDADFHSFAGAVADQAWCLHHFERFAPQYQQLVDDPEPLIAWIKARFSSGRFTAGTMRLGRYFEALIGYWLHHAPSIANVSKSVQVKQGKQTVGEFDFLFSDLKSQKSYHLEVAVKYYLRCGSEPGWQNYLGPQGQDRLDLKLRLIFDKQLKLSQTPEGQEAATLALHSTNISRLALVKGYLFEPLSDFDEGLGLSVLGLSPERLTGWWIFVRDVNERVMRSPDSRWRVLPKVSWMSASRGDDLPAMLGPQEFIFCLLAHFKESQTPQLVAELKRASLTEEWSEGSRGFVVANDWPLGQR
jgi:hypothetical protein